LLPRGHRGVVGEDVLGHDLLLLSEQARANDFRQSLLDAMRGAAVSSGITGPGDDLVTAHGDSRARDGANLGCLPSLPPDGHVPGLRH